ncbi:MAG: alpha-L-rhamnosidase N-terminal domain-containing protein [Candidatus Omnitrophica bacterium]|nr:alpha-L-rhamnosidase N-terminal domain-containing protein [Candidatus Omnitrophota bacterium]
MNMVVPRSFRWQLTLLLGFLIGLIAPRLSAATAAELEAAAGTPLKAKWIWCRDNTPDPYNQTIVARKRLQMRLPKHAILRITADSFYRLMINERWVNDGPCRAWPDHYQYDVIDVTHFLVNGPNEVRIIARYYGTGDFHHVPQEPGLLAQLDWVGQDGHRHTLITDRSWETALAKAWVSNTPKVSIQMEPCELFDARLANQLTFGKAAEICGAFDGPWKDLHPRDVPLLTKQPVAFRRFLGASLVKAEGRDFCLPAARLVNPGVIEANQNASCACGMATVIDAKQECTVRLANGDMKLAVDGRRNQQNLFSLKPGRHILVAFVHDVCGHQKEKSLRLLTTEGFTLENPVKAGYENPWIFLRFPEFAFATNDMRWMNFRGEDKRITSMIDRYGQLTEQLLGSVKDLDSFRTQLGTRAEVMPSNAMFVIDTTWQFQNRQVVGDAGALVQNPGGLIYNNADATIIQPTKDGDVELLYDLGEQDCGYYQFELIADAGVCVDIDGVEYIAPDGRIQHTLGNRNGLRYITKQGLNHFISLKSRSGRYIFVTLRNQKSPVQLCNLSLVESTYPVNYLGSFACSDARLNEVWDISTRTLKLCMEDTFVDCPLYEQTLWVGDARNESLLAYGVFGATDIARRCILLADQSLERYPIVGCQVPSSWDCLLPAWSFLWGISTWDYYWETGDKTFLRQIYPDVIRNLKGAEKFVNDRDLFSGPFWNMFDWTGADQSQKTVLHNSMFMVGAINAALEEAGVLDDSTYTAWLEQLRARLIKGINQLWDPAKGAYPDAIRDDGSISPSTCQHTSFLSILYNIIPPADLDAAKRNLTQPPPNMIKIGSPFAMLYLYETYEKLGMDDQIIQSIYKNYLPMLESGASTVWESFPSGTTGSGGFPTRSHCHGWSSAPTLYLPRIILGVKETTAGGASCQISPHLNGLQWAHGRVESARGPIEVSWTRTGDTLEVTYQVPGGVKAEFKSNDTLRGLKVVVNGTKFGG